MEKEYYQYLIAYIDLKRHVDKKDLKVATDQEAQKPHQTNVKHDEMVPEHDEAVPEPDEVIPEALDAS